MIISEASYHPPHISSNLQKEVKKKEIFSHHVQIPRHINDLFGDYFVFLCKKER